MLDFIIQIDAQNHYNLANQNIYATNIFYLFLTIIMKF